MIFMKMGATSSWFIYGSPAPRRVPIGGHHMLCKSMNEFIFNINVFENLPQSLFLVLSVDQRSANFFYNVLDSKCSRFGGPKYLPDIHLESSHSQSVDMVVTVTQ